MDKERLTTELDSSMSTLNEKVNETEKQSELIVELEDHVEKLQDHVNQRKCAALRSKLRVQKLMILNAKQKPPELPS